MTTTSSTTGAPAAKDAAAPPRPAFADSPLGQVLRSPDLRRVAPGLALSALLSNLLSLGLPLAILQIMDRVVANQSLETLAFLVGGIVVALVLEEVLRTVSSVVTGWLGIRYEHKVGLAALERLLRVPMRRFRAEEAGVYAERILASAKVAEFYSGQALLVVFDLPFVVLFLAIIMAIGGWVALVPAVLLAAFVALSLLFGRRLSDQIELRQVLDDRRSSFLAEVLANIHTVKTQAMELLMARRYERLQEANAGIGEQLTGSSARATDLGTLFSQVMVVGVISAGSAAVIAGQMTPGGLAAVMLLSVRALQPLRRSLTIWLRYQSFVSAQQRLNDIMALPFEDGAARPPLPPLRQGLELRGISLSHGAGRLFSDLSLTVPAGQCVAIQGDSGSGKTTLLSLVNGLERAEQGQVLLDGLPVEGYAPDSLHKEIAFLPQAGRIMAGTILENMTMFDPSLNQAALAIARAMGLDRVVAGMKAGYETQLGEGQGETLPEGVRQMIAIARALAHDPSVILFDETNISLDMDGDRRLRDYLAACKGVRTMILVTHRPSMLSLADRVYSLADGRLREGRLHEPSPAEQEAQPAPAPERPEPMTDLAALIAAQYAEPSDLARCLAPLLAALDWQGQPRHLADALPHLARELDLSGLCSVLSNLGFPPRHFETTLDTLDERLLPCLFLAPDTPAMVVLGPLPDGGLRVFDSGAGAVKSLAPEALGQLGEAYLFRQQTPAEAKAQRGESWFGSLVWRLRKHLALILALTVVSTALALAPPLFVKTVFDTVIPSGDMVLGQLLTLGVVLMIGLDWLLRGLKNRVLAYVGGRTEYVLGTGVFERVICLPASATEGASSARQLERIKNLESLRDFFLGPLVLIAFELPASLVMLLALAVVNPWVVLVMALAIAAYAALWFGTRRWNQSSMARASQAATTRSEFINEVLASMRLIRSAGAAQTWLKRFHDVSGKAVLAAYQDQQLRVRTAGAAQILGMCTGLFAMAASAWLAIAGNLTGGAMVATMMIVWRLTGPIQNVFLAASSLVRTRSNIRQIENLMRLPMERESGIKPVARPELSGELAFARVSFRYANDADPALLGLNFTVEPGQMVVIAGPNGAGKSTLLKLIVRVYSPQAGTIRLDQLDIRQLAAAELRGGVSYMPQNCEIFHGTVLQNLKLVHPVATDAELRWAVDMAGLTADIAALPQGFETRISDSRSEQLPYGFRQRLLLARVMLKPASVVLLDEPGTGMDQAGEQALIRCLAWLRGRSTLLVVSHRPGHMRMADRVICMNNGAVTAMGPFDSVKANVMAGLG
ncbi:peptidase domain-containing ABC transporter [Pseudoduganella namucuonensis]|uniref:ATP-binding cassette, subfamily B n=1 Tax=Pseudoduganella namucuonensis TaxID=1035707 RepID=A0A1I7KY14_9BURK|nr:ATP-binding cassette domain-containing protein [Pseudoduganella namucuonensis]SFV02402.1 ATP-binding cassette, subfamily B [Pseudoduganella namucuonensis]